MRAINLQRAVRIVLLAGVGVLSAGQAGASGFALAEQNSSGLGNAYAGAAAVAEDASTIFFNSAGLSQISRPSLVVNLSGINIDSKFHDSGSVAALGQSLPPGGTGGNAGDFTVLPSVYFAMPVAPGFSAGLGVNAPFGLKTEYDSSWMGRYQAIKSDVKTTNINLAVAYQLNKMISLGAGVDYQTINATLTSAVNYDAVIAGAIQANPLLSGLVSSIPTIISLNPGLQGASKVKGDDSATGFNVGLLLTPTEQTRIGLSYRSAFKYNITGNTTITAPDLTLNPLNPSTPGLSTVSTIIPGAKASSNANGLADGPITLNLKLPASARLAIVQEMGNKLELLGEVSWTQWSSVQKLEIVRTNGVLLSKTDEKWQNTMRYAVGANYKLMDTLKLRAGIAFDESPVPDSTRTPRLPDADRTWLSAGGKFDINKNVALDFAYAHLFVKDAKLNQDNTNAVAYGLLAGKQKTSIDILGVQATVGF